MEHSFKKYVVMCVGGTYTGKTTFARQLARKHPKLVHLDSDDVAVFLREKYPLIVDSAYNKSRPDLKKANLKITVFKDIYSFCLKVGLNLILSNGNLARDIRSFVADEAMKHRYELVTVYFNLPREVILRRMAKTKKSTNVFIHSKSWAEVLERQEIYAQLPPSKKNTIYFEIQSKEDYYEAMQAVDKLLG